MCGEGLILAIAFFHFYYFLDHKFQSILRETYGQHFSPVIHSF